MFIKHLPVGFGGGVRRTEGVDCYRLASFTRLGAHLPQPARRTLINLLRELPITMLVSTHDMRLVQELFPHTIIMDERRVVADGLTLEILEDEVLLIAHGLEKL